MEDVDVKIEEQPEVDSGSSNSEEVEERSERSEAERGVPIGKFKSVDDLYQAYNNLQSEFTRKCQKLSEFEKDKMAEKLSEQKSQEKILEDKFRSFLAENQEAYGYADEIKSKVLSDETLRSLEKPFDKVWSQMIIEKFSMPNKAKEPLVQNFVLNDEELKNLVIKNYVEQLQNNKTPVVMSTSCGERVTKTVTPKPDSFEQAKQVVLDLLS